MSRQHKFQDKTKRQLEYLNKLVQNKKSRYRTQKGIELNPLIQTKKITDFSSRKEYEKYVRDMERFLDRKTQYVENSKGNLFTTETVKRYEKHVERVNKQIERERKRIAKLETQIMGTKLGMTVGERMKLGGKDLFHNLTPLTGSLERFSSEKELKKVLKERFEIGKNAEQKAYYRGEFLRRGDIQYRKNFIQSLDTVFGNGSQHLQNYIKRMKLDEFMNVYYETTGTIDINYVYDDNEELKNRLKTLELTILK